MSRLLPVVFLLQKALLMCSFGFFRFFNSKGGRRRTIDWVVGTNEIASVLFRISQALPRSYSVSFTSGDAYNFSYDYRLATGGTPRARAIRRLIVGPVLLGRLANQARGFLYVGATGFLLESLDQREFEFRFLNRRGLKIGIYWCGSEIRSTKIMHELERKMGLPNVSTYIGMVSPYFETTAHEQVQQRRARVADTYADVMFDFPTDQASYLSRRREPYFYFMPTDRFVDDTDKFDDLSRIVITHATTSPMIKGTPLVRAAVARLRSEGYSFEYVELIGVSNAELLTELARTHIALNQFYGFTTTIFGIEALASQCALLTSSDGTIETNLPPHANDAVMLTKHWQVYDNLKLLLDHPERIEILAKAGQAWAKRYVSSAVTGPLLSGILDTVLNGSYRAEDRARITTAQVYDG